MAVRLLAISAPLLGRDVKIRQSVYSDRLPTAYASSLLGLVLGVARELDTFPEDLALTLFESWSSKVQTAVLLLRAGRLRQNPGPSRSPWGR